MLIASPKPVVGVIWAYHKNQAPSLFQNEIINRINRNEAASNHAVFEEKLQVLLENYKSSSDIQNFIQQNQLSPDQSNRLNMLKKQITKHEGI